MYFSHFRIPDSFKDIWTRTKKLQWKLKNYRVIFVEYEKMPIGRYIMSRSVEKGIFVHLSVSDTLFHLLHINISGMK